jgi:hypothetical protein
MRFTPVRIEAPEEGQKGASFAALLVAIRE